MNDKLDKIKIPFYGYDSFEDFINGEWSGGSVFTYIDKEIPIEDGERKADNYMLSIERMGGTRKHPIYKCCLTYIGKEPEDPKDWYEWYMEADSWDELAATAAFRDGTKLLDWFKKEYHIEE